MKSLLTVTVAVALSIVSSVWVTTSRKFNTRSDTIQAKQFEIRDSSNTVRVEIGIANQFGREVPQMTFRDEKGNIASLLTLDETGNGTLYFNGNGTEGKVAVGYLWGSDTKSLGENVDPLGAWGVRILGSEGLQTAIGISNSGKVILPSPSPNVFQHAH